MFVKYETRDVKPMRQLPEDGTLSFYKTSSKLIASSDYVDGKASSNPLINLERDEDSKPSTSGHLTKHRSSAVSNSALQRRKEISLVPYDDEGNSEHEVEICSASQNIKLPPKGEMAFHYQYDEYDEAIDEEDFEDYNSRHFQYQCKLCPARCNNKDAYNAHMNGAKHKKNLKKDRVRPHNDPTTVLEDSWRNDPEPFIGLGCIKEVVFSGTAGNEMRYNCFLCGIGEFLDQGDNV
jgi:hypothetical protein